ncbi:MULTISPECIES: chemotaxis protein CheB [unclassified Pseudomonas]|uniref:chemotaxis protein CheB n=1 Tax=unclassified Pseudomonas TaxID=196821 RepID=UPI0025805A65|nr:MULTISPECIES: chemotaxis protein CheB [unclassified Pseudomonas]
MTEKAIVRVAILADTSLQRYVLQQVLAGNGYQVVFNSDPTRLDVEALRACETDLWLVDLAESEDSNVLEDLLEHTSTPVLFGEGQAPEFSSDLFPRWERRLITKLKHLVGDTTEAVGPSLQALLADTERPERLSLPASLASTPLQMGESAKEVWLLAASLGGPDAVKTFLDALPGGLPIGFLYAQHIDANFEATLPMAVGRHSQWHVQIAQPGLEVRCGEVIVVPTQNELSFRNDSKLDVLSRKWPEPYTPSVDQMMLNLAQHFGSRCGMIIFNGMGNDGSSSAAYMRRRGAEIWTQSADSCSCASMPETLREAGFSSFTSDPRGLAEALVNRLAKQHAH